jgi:Ca2+-binding EF-hand superfamily protein
MKNAAAGLLVALGLCTCFRASADPRRTANEGSQAKTSALRGEQNAAQAVKTTPAVETLGVETPPAATLFAAADDNGDGSVTYRELAAVVRNSIARRIKARFHQLDRNRDGRCTRSEVNKMTAARFARFDLNHDGAFTVAELAHVMTHEVTVRLQQVYARLDGDQNGRLSMAELKLQPKAQPAAVAARVSSDPGRKTADVAKRPATVH